MMIFARMCVITNTAGQEQFVKNLSGVLKKLITNNKQLAALFEIQKFFHAKPGQKANVEKMFHFLHDFGVIPSQVFNQWLQDKDNTTPGKDMLTQLVSKWISTLPEAEEEEEIEEETYDYYAEEEDEEYKEQDYVEEEEEEQD